MYSRAPLPVAKLCAVKGGLHVIIIHLVTNVSYTLLMVEVSEMGRGLSIDSVGTALGMGTTVARFHCCGTKPDAREELRMLLTGRLSSKVKSLMSLLGILVPVEQAIYSTI